VPKNPCSIITFLIKNCHILGGKSAWLGKPQSLGEVISYSYPWWLYVKNNNIHNIYIHTSYTSVIMSYLIHIHEYPLCTSYILLIHIPWYIWGNPSPTACAPLALVDGAISPAPYSTAVEVPCTEVALNDGRAQHGAAGYGLGPQMLDESTCAYVVVWVGGFGDLGNWSLSLMLIDL